MDVPGPLHFTGFLIRRAQQVHVAAWQSEVSPEISSVQFGVLAALARIPDASQRELCDELDLDRSTIADLVARLQRRGLLERERDGGDRRRNVLRLTASGAAELERLEPHVEAVERRLTERMSSAERRELRRLLGLVLGGVQPDGAPDM